MPSGIDTRLRGSWKREQDFLHARGVCHLVFWLVGVVVASFLVDWLFVLPGVLRLGLAVAGLAVLIAVIYRRWLRHLRLYDPVRVALQVENFNSGSQSLLVSHVQLRDPDSADAGRFSHGMIEAMHRQAEERASSLDFDSLVRFAELRRPAILAVTAVAVFAASIVAAPEHYRVFMARMFDPGSVAGYPTRTLLVGVTGELAIRQGDPIEIEATASGEVPESADLVIRFSDGLREEITLSRQDGDRFVYHLEKSARDFEYSFRVGDARSGPHTVDVVPPPRVVESVARLRFPEYTREPPREERDLNLEALQGTAISLQVVCDCALQAGALSVEDGESIPLRVDAADPRHASVELEARESFAYRFRWQEKEHGFRYDGAVRYTVRVRPDGPPRVEVLEPERELRGTTAKELAIVFRATDDHGLARANIVYSLKDGPQKRLPLGSLGDSGGAPRTARWKPSVVLPELAPGDTVFYAIEVSDNRALAGEEPNIARSTTRRLDVVSVEDYLKYIEEKKARLFTGIQEVLREEGRGSRNVKSLKERSQ